MKIILELLALLAVLIAYSTAKNFWFSPLQVLMKELKQMDGPGSEKADSTPIPTSTTSITTSSCVNGCLKPTIGTTNGPVAPPNYNTNYNGRDPIITSYPTTQP